MNVAEAAPFPSLKGEQLSPGFHEAQYRRDRDSRMERKDRSPRREGGRGFERRGNDNYYNGQRGYRDYRRGYRQYNGWWFPPSAFIAGAILGGTVASPPVVVQRPAPVRLSAAHVRWCQDRWKSYRVSDNTYQPSNGPRQVCVSPY